LLRSTAVVGVSMVVLLLRNPACWVSNTGSDKPCAILKLAIRKIADVDFLGIRLSEKRVFQPGGLKTLKIVPH